MIRKRSQIENQAKVPQAFRQPERDDGAFAVAPNACRLGFGPSFPHDLRDADVVGKVDEIVNFNRRKEHLIISDRGAGGAEPPSPELA